jgi:hypothetical protein
MSINEKVGTLHVTGASDDDPSGIGTYSQLVIHRPTLSLALESSVAAD